MVVSNKRVALEGDSEDRITDLPGNVIDCILKYLPVRDAARTCILSSKWRYIWAAHPQIVLDKHFSQGIMPTASPAKLDFVDIVSKILLQHVGPIWKFHLDLSGVYVSKYLIIDQWIMFLSRNGVRELTLYNNAGESYHVTYLLPSCLFSCLELTYLNVSNCMLKPLYPSSGFNKLTILRLGQINFSTNAASHALCTPMLVYLAFNGCVGIHFFKVHAPLLKILTISNSSNVDLSSFVVFQKLEIVYVIRTNDVKVSGDRLVTLAKLRSSCPSVVQLQLGGFFFKNMDMDVAFAPTWTPVTNSFLKKVVLSNLKLTDLNKISQTVRYLQSIPKLKILCIALKALDANPVAMEAVFDDLEMNQLLNALQTVVMGYFTGSRAEMLFAKILLASAPLLERMDLIQKVEGKINEQTSEKLLQFYRASPKAAVRLLDSCRGRSC